MMNKDSKMPSKDGLNNPQRLAGQNQIFFGQTKQFLVVRVKRHGLNKKIFILSNNFLILSSSPLSQK
jgi:hypothetical protein